MSSPGAILLEARRLTHNFEKYEVKPLEINSKWSEDSFLCLEPTPIKKALTQLEWIKKKG